MRTPALGSSWLTAYLNRAHSPLLPTARGGGRWQSGSLQCPVLGGVLRYLASKSKATGRESGQEEGSGGFHGARLSL